MTGYRQTGNLPFARTEDETDVIHNLVHSQAASGLQIELPDIRQGKKFAPALSNEFWFASWCPTDGHADSFKSVEGFQRAAERLGVTFRINTTVIKIDT